VPYPIMLFSVCDGKQTCHAGRRQCSQCSCLESNLGLSIDHLTTRRYSTQFPCLPPKWTPQLICQHPGPCVVKQKPVEGSARSLHVHGPFQSDAYCSPLAHSVLPVSVQQWLKGTSVSNSISSEIGEPRLNPVASNLGSEEWCLLGCYPVWLL
jgi:hypothetical protein